MEIVVETLVYAVALLVVCGVLIDVPFLLKMIYEKRKVGFIQRKNAKIIALIVSPIVWGAVQIIIFALGMMNGGLLPSMSLVVSAGSYACVFFSVRALFKKWSD